MLRTREEAGPQSGPAFRVSTNLNRYMTQKLITAPEDMSAKQAFLLMQTHRVRHIPVVNGETLVGILSAQDLLEPFEEALMILGSKS